MDYAQSIIMAVFGGGFFCFLEFLIKRHDERKDTPEKRALKNILARNLLFDLRDWLHADKRTAEEWQIIHDNYESYKELGGNGKIKKLYSECADIPTTE